MSTTKATPRPWTTGKTINGDGRQVFTFAFNTAHPSKVATASPEDAELIVQAVNAHDDLLEACKALLECDEYDADPWVSNAIEAAKAAIAKAKGTTK